MEWSVSDYNFLQLSQASNVCVCCLAKDIQLIYLKTCTHYSLLSLYFGNVLNGDELVCLGCHGMLKKFHTFKLQVEENISFLNHQKENVAGTRKTHNLERTGINIYNTPISPDEEDYIPIDTFKCENVLKIDKYNVDSLEEPTLDCSINNDNCKFEKNICNIKQELSGSEQDQDYTIVYNDIANHKHKDINSQNIEIEIPITNYKNEIYSSTQYTDVLPKKLENYKRRNKRVKRKKERNKICKNYKSDQILSATSEIVSPLVATPLPIENLRYTCDYCGRMFRWKCTLQRHLVGAHVNSRLQCTHCPKVFKNDLALKRHVQSLHEKKDATDSAPVQCPICQNMFKWKKTLHVHLKRMHRPYTGKGEERYCVECDKLFKSSSTYELHLKNTIKHAGNKYECHDCSKKFSLKANLVEHIQRLHLQRKNHACTICGKLFYKKYLRRQHEQHSHFGVPKQRNHMCNLCGKAFTSSTILKIHMLVHSGVKKYQCEYCPSKFSQSSTLKTHCKFKHKDVFYYTTGQLDGRSKKQLQL